MKLLLPLLLSSTALAFSFVPSSSNNPTTNDDDLSVPGANPLKFCEDPVAAKHILIIEKVDLDPNPPLAGQTLSIKATGNFTKEVLDGAYVDIVVRLGRVPVLHRVEDLCKQIKEVDKECPLEEGETTVTKDVELPSYIPPGKITVTANVYSVDDERITCLIAEVQFSGRSAATNKKELGAQAPMEKDSVDL